MHIYGHVVQLRDLDHIADRLGIQLYNVSTLPTVQRGRNAGRNHFSLTLRPGTDEYYRDIAPSGRRKWACTWEAHRDFMRAVFEIDPDTEFDSVLARYRGSDEFERLHRLTGTDMSHGYSSKVSA